MTLLSRLRKRQQLGETTQVAIVGAGLMGRGIVRQIDLTPGMRSALIVNRTVQRAVDAYLACGHQADDIIVSNDVEALLEAIWSRKSPAVSRFERIWASTRRNRSSSISPAATSLIGGMMMPSWNTSRNAPTDAGAPPPTSTWWARQAV